MLKCFSFDHIIKLPFSLQEHLQIFPHFSFFLPSGKCLLLFNFVLDRVQKNIFYCQFGKQNYMDQVLKFLLVDKDEWMHGTFRSVIIVSIFTLWV